MSPFTPYTCEELWEMISCKGFVSLETWPKYNEKMIDEKAESSHQLVDSVKKDIAYILGLIKVENPKKITLFVSEKWKYRFFKELKKQIDKTRDVKEIIKEVIPKCQENSKQASKIIPAVVKNPSKIPCVILDDETEFNTLNNSKQSVEDEFKCDVEIIKADESEEQKAKNAMPGKPAVLVE